MSECYLILCLIKSLTMDWSVGYQYLPELDSPLTDTYTNDYGVLIGEASIVLELENGLFFEAKHISGLNTQEKDEGLNSLMFGMKINLLGE